MQSALFTFRRKVIVKINGEDQEVFNDNFINPLNVTSFYWSQTADGKSILNVFLNAVRSTNSGTNAYSLTFGESVGKRFVLHMEEFLCYLVSTKVTSTHNTNTNNNNTEKHNRPSRRVLDVVEDDQVVETATDAQWAQ